MFGLITKPLKAIAGGNAQKSLGLQSPHLPGQIVRLGRFFYLTGIGWVSIVWYSAYANMRTAPGSGPTLVLPGSKIVGAPDRPDKHPSFATALADSSAAVAAGQGLVGTAANTVANALGIGTQAGGFLPPNAKYIPGRADQGRDGTTNPGGPMVAPGAGVVLRVGSDPAGFGPDYPIIKFSSGPYAGRIIYYGHTHATVVAGQRVNPGQVVAHTGTHGVGNATVPGWFEVGYADSGSPGPYGQKTPF